MLLKKFIGKIFLPFSLFLLSVLFFSFFYFRPDLINMNLETLFVTYYPSLLIVFAQLLTVFILEGYRYRKAKRNHARFEINGYIYTIVLLIPFFTSMFIQSDFGINIIISTGLYCLTLSIFIILVEIFKKKVITWEDFANYKKK